jgi:hypothetical protein
MAFLKAHPISKRTPQKISPLYVHLIILFWGDLTYNTSSDNFLLSLLVLPLGVLVFLLDSLASIPFCSTESLLEFIK